MSSVLLDTAKYGTLRDIVILEAAVKAKVEAKIPFKRISPYNVVLVV